jgi:hypothetical protein
MFPGQKEVITPELQHLVADHSTPLATVLDLPYVAKAARTGYQALQDYMIPKASELLRAALSEEMGKASVNAFNILTCNPVYLQPVLENGVLLDMATGIVTRPELPPFLIGRLSSLSLNALYHLPDLATISCGFIYHLLKYCENPTVFNLFENLTGDAPEVGPAQKWLQDMGFSLYITREFNNLNFDYVSTEHNTYKDAVYNKTVYLLQLISRSCRNQTLQADFWNEDIVNCLKKATFPDPPDFVSIARWEAIVGVTSAATHEFCKCFLAQAFKLLTDPFEKLKAYRVSALTFVTRMMELAPSTFDAMMRTQMPQMVINLVFQFPNSTILHNAFVKFVEVGLTNSLFAMFVISVYIPVVMYNGESNENRVVKACCMRVMRLFWDLADRDGEIAQMMGEFDGVNDFLAGPLTKYMEKTEKPYGGELPKYDLKSLSSWFK